MKNLKNVFTLMMAGLLFLATACDKDKTNPADETATCLLTKITWLDDDGDEIINLQYDANRRLVKYSEEYEGETYSATFEYNADGKMSAYTTFTGDIEESRVFFTWTSNSMTETYEYKNESGDWVEEEWKGVFIFDINDQIIKYQGFDKDGDSWIEYSYELFFWANGNITKSENWRTSNKKMNAKTIVYDKILKKRNSHLLKFVMDTKRSTTIYEYDDKNNAFTSLGIIWGIESFSKNNLTKVVTTDTDGDTYSYTNTYEYNDKGFPTKITETWVDSYDGTTYTDVTLLAYDCN